MKIFLALFLILTLIFGGYVFFESRELARTFTLVDSTAEESVLLKSTTLIKISYNNDSSFAKTALKIKSVEMIFAFCYAILLGIFCYNLQQVQKTFIFTNLFGFLTLISLLAGVSNIFEDFSCILLINIPQWQWLKIMTDLFAVLKWVFIIIVLVPVVISFFTKLLTKRQ